MKQFIAQLLLVIAVLALASCGKKEDASQSAAGSAADSTADTATDTESTSTSANTVSATAQDINPQERDSLKGGKLTLSVTNFAENWNPMHVDGNNYDYSQIREPMLPTFFDFDEAGVPTPNPDYVVSVEVVNEDPTEVRYKLNPKAVWLSLIHI